MTSLVAHALANLIGRSLREGSHIDFVHEKRHMFVWGFGGGGGGGVGSCDVSL